MVKCSFSGKEIAPGTGKMYVRKDGRILYFDSSKSEKNFLMGRRSRNVRWTADARKAKEERAHQASHEAVAKKAVKKTAKNTKK